MRPRLLRSGLTGRVYVATRYTERDGQITASTKYDVTEEFDALAREAAQLRAELLASITLPDGVGHWFENRAHWFDPTSAPMPGCPACAAITKASR